MLKYLRYVCLVGPRLIWDTLVYLLRYARHPEKYPYEVRYKRVRDLIVYVLNRMRIDFKVKGYREYLERNQTRHIVCNHLSNMDPLILVALSPEPISFIGKIEVSGFPVVGPALKAIDGLFLDRKDMLQSAKILREAGKRLKEGKTYVIFPEGTRNKDRDNLDLLPFHAGSFKAAVWADVPVECVALYGSFRILDRKFDAKRLPVEVDFLGQLEKNNDTTVLCKQAEEKMGEAVREMKAYDASYFEAGRHKKGLGKLPRPYIHN